MKKLFSKEECQAVIDFAESKNAWKLGSSKGNVDALNRPSIPAITTAWELDFFREKLLEYAREELQLDIKTAGIHIMKYNTGDSFPRHIDRNGSIEFNMDFLYNINVVLNDEFEGGQFYLDDKLIEFNSPGMVYHYKSTIYHEVTEVTKGIRYSALFFIRDRDLKTIKNIL